MGVKVEGTAADDDLVHPNAIADGYDQIHIRAGLGDDIIHMDFAEAIKKPGSSQAEVNAHHAYGDQGADEFRFENVDNVTDNDVRMVGRLDDFDYSQDTILIDGVSVDLKTPSSNVKIVAYQDQQWMLINDNILYALEGARRRDEDPSGGDDGEERHFVDWPASLVEINYVDPVNYVPLSHYNTLTLNSIFTEDQTITGTGGSDHIYSQKKHGYGNTDQTINGDGGNDVIDAGQGHDTVYGGLGNDSIAGGLDEDYLVGQDGNDHIWGGSENDEIRGGRGDDHLFGGSQDDSLYGDEDADRLSGGSGNDSLRGGAGNDSLYGENGADVLRGGGGEDLLHGGKGDDELRGASGDDTLYGDEGADVLKGQNGNDLLYGGDGDDALSGAHGNDTIRGDAGDDSVYGRADDDLLKGNDGDDRIQGDSGNDTLWGGSGADRFVFKDGDGSDKIRDFDVHEVGEVIDLTDVSAINSFADLILNHAEDVGPDVVIDTGEGNQFRIDDVLVADLSADDFLF